ncbi:TPA: phage tail protein I [Stenotrophomonas maltophilia]
MNSSDLLPPNSTKGERALVDAATMRRLPVQLPELWDADKCPADLLPWLAWALSVDEWKAYWPEQVKRARVRSAIAIQRRKGTARSVMDVVESFGGSLSIREWFEMDPPGAPHTFDMVLTIAGNGGASSSAQFVEDVISEVSRTKPVRSHFTFTQGLQFTQDEGIANGIRAVTYGRLAFNGD